MKKRFFAIFLAVCLVVTLLPAGVLAADGETVSVGGVKLSGSAQTPAYATTDSEGNVTAGGSEDNYKIKWDGETLTLNGATIKGNSGKGIVYRDGDLTISLVGTNKMIYIVTPAAYTSTAASLSQATASLMSQA